MLHLLGLYEDGWMDDGGLRGQCSTNGHISALCLPVCTFVHPVDIFTFYEVDSSNMDELLAY